MNIHTVVEGETLYSIARKYGVPATKILADNDLSGDRLLIGEELLILMPTRTVTVRGSDTIEKISARFDTKPSKILANNPSLGGKPSLRPGQILTVKQDAPTLGAATALGYIYKGARRENLTRALPYITYLSVMCANLSECKIQIVFDGSWARDTAIREGKLPLIGITDTSGGDFLTAPQHYTDIISGMKKAAHGGGYKGVLLSARDASHKHPEKFCEFIMQTRKNFIGSDLILFTEVDSNSPKDASELSDGSVFFPSDTSIDTTCTELEKFSENTESSKVFVSLTTVADCGGQPLIFADAKTLCHRAGLRLGKIENELMHCFDYKRYRFGKCEEIRIKFPSVEYTKTKLERLSELGFMGISVDIDTAPSAHFCLFNAMFFRADYALS